MEKMFKGIVGLFVLIHSENLTIMQLIIVALWDKKTAKKMCSDIETHYGNEFRKIIEGLNDGSESDV